MLLLLALSRLLMEEWRLAKLMVINKLKIKDLIKKIAVMAWMCPY